MPGVIEKSPHCWRRQITPDSQFMLELHVHYRAGHLAVAGGVLDQPARYLEAMQLITEWRERGTGIGNR